MMANTLDRQTTEGDLGGGAVFLTRWQRWYDHLRQEHKFHCDLLLPQGWRVTLTLRNPEGEVVADYVVPAPTVAGRKWVKVHIALAHEGRDTLDVG